MLIDAHSSVSCHDTRSQWLLLEGFIGIPGCSPYIRNVLYILQTSLVHSHLLADKYGVQRCRPQAFFPCTLMSMDTTQSGGSPSASGLYETL